MATKDKKFWILLIFILAGIVVGGLINEFATQAGAPSYLTKEYPFGLESPINLDFQVLKIQFGFLININLFTVLGMLLGIFVYRKV